MSLRNRAHPFVDFDQVLSAESARRQSPRSCSTSVRRKVPRKIRLRVVIADDERPARGLLAAGLARIHAVEIVAQVGSGREALDAVKQLAADLLFVDVAIPCPCGCEVARALRATGCLVVLVSAFDEHEEDARSAGAFARLGKPVGSRRLAELVERALEQTGALWG